MTEFVTIEKLVHGGQGLGTLPDGRKIFVWNALPGEEVEVEVSKSKKTHAEGFATKIIKPSPDRISELGREDIELSTQPLKIMSYEAELSAKRSIVTEIFERESVILPDFEAQSTGPVNHYRNKVEFSFWGDEAGLHYAHYLRATHRKIFLELPYNDLIYQNMSDQAKALLQELNDQKIRAGSLKSVIIRSETASKNAKVALALFVKTKTFPKLKLDNLVVYYSDPKSPASITTEKIYQNGSTILSDRLLGCALSYDVLSFFQVNLPFFELALKRIDHLTSGSTNKVDMYSGVGSIGIPIGGTKVLVELDPVNAKMARENVSKQPIEVVEASTEKALRYITKDSVIIVDPPRSGLHKDVVAKIINEKPAQIVYLSCNPATQARDVRLLVDGGYKIQNFDAYNFFPRTPHIETLISLTLS